MSGWSFACETPKRNAMRCAKLRKPTRSAGTPAMFLEIWKRNLEFFGWFLTHFLTPVLCKWLTEIHANG
jgi:hypothetical protein